MTALLVQQRWSVLEKTAELAQRQQALESARQCHAIAMAAARSYGREIEHATRSGQPLNPDLLRWLISGAKAQQEQTTAFSAEVEQAQHRVDENTRELADLRKLEDHLKEEIEKLERAQLSMQHSKDSQELCDLWSQRSRPGSEKL